MRVFLISPYYKPIKTIIKKITQKSPEIQQIPIADGGMVCSLDYSSYNICIYRLRKIKILYCFNILLDI